MMIDVIAMVKTMSLTTRLMPSFFSCYALRKSPAGKKGREAGNGNDWIK